MTTWARSVSIALVAAILSLAAARTARGAPGGVPHPGTVGQGLDANHCVAFGVDRNLLHGITEQFVMSFPDSPCMVVTSGEFYVPQFSWFVLPDYTQDRLDRLDAFCSEAPAVCGGATYPLQGVTPMADFVAKFLGARFTVENLETGRIVGYHEYPASILSTHDFIHGDALTSLDAFPDFYVEGDIVGDVAQMLGKMPPLPPGTYLITTWWNMSAFHSDDETDLGCPIDEAGCSLWPGWNEHGGPRTFTVVPGDKN